jgi:hypothetical protein
LKKLPATDPVGPVGLQPTRKAFAVNIFEQHCTLCLSYHHCNVVIGADPSPEAEPEPRIESNRSVLDAQYHLAPRLCPNGSTRPLENYQYRDGRQLGPECGIERGGGELRDSRAGGR